MYGFLAKYLISGVLILSVLGGTYVKYIFMQNDIAEGKKEIIYQQALVIAAELKFDVSVALNYENAKNLVLLKTAYAHRVKLLDQKYKQEAKRIKTITIIKERIKYVKAKDDGAVAAILNSTLHRLRRAQSDTVPENNSSAKNTDTKSRDTNTTHQYKTTASHPPSDKAE